MGYLKDQVERTISLSTLANTLQNSDHAANLHLLRKTLESSEPNMQINHPFFTHRKEFQKLVAAAQFMVAEENLQAQKVYIQLLRPHRWMGQDPELSEQEAMACAFSPLSLRELFENKDDAQNVSDLIAICTQLLPAGLGRQIPIVHHYFQDIDLFKALLWSAELMELEGVEKKYVKRQLGQIQSRMAQDPGLSLETVMIYGFPPHRLAKFFNNPDEAQNIQKLIKISEEILPGCYSKVIHHPYLSEESFKDLLGAAKFRELELEIRRRLVQRGLRKIGATLAQNPQLPRKKAVFDQFSPQKLREMFQNGDDEENVSLLISIWENLLPRKILSSRTFEIDRKEN